MAVLMILVTWAALGCPGCSIKKPLAPTWDVNLAIPLAHRVTYMDEIVERTSILHVDTTATDTSIVAFEVTQEIPSSPIGDNLRLLVPGAERSWGLNPITYPSLGLEMPLVEVWPDSRLLQDSTLVIGPIPGVLQATSGVPPSSLAFERMQLDRGNLVAEVRNGYPFAMENLQIVFTDATYGLIGALAFPSLGLGQTVADSIPLDGTSLTNALTFQVSFTSLGSGQPVTVDTLAALGLTLTFRDLVLASGTAQIPAQSMQLRDSTELLNMRVNDALLRGGTVSVFLENQLPLDLSQLLMTFPQMRSPLGDTLRLPLPVPPGSTRQFSLGLSGCSFHGTAERYLKYRLEGVCPATPIVALNAADSLRMLSTFSDLTLENVDGVLDSVRVALEPAEQTVEIPEGLEGVRLTAPTLRLSFDYGREIHVPLRFQLTFVGVDQRDVSHDLRVEETTYLPGDPAILLDTTNSTVGDFLYYVPTRIALDTTRSRLYLGDGAHAGTISREDVVSGDAVFGAPFDAILGPVEISSDPESTTIDPDVNLPPVAGSVQYWVTNHLPLAVDTIEILVSEDSATLFVDPQVRVGPVTIPAPVLDASGRVIAPRETTGTLVLIESDLAVFENPDQSRSKKLYSGLILKLPGTDGERIKVYADDYLEVRAIASLTMRVDKDEFESP
jgi:hypothetical protein